MLYITCINLPVKSRIFNFQTTLPMRFLEDFPSYIFFWQKGRFIHKRVFHNKTRYTHVL